MNPNQRSGSEPTPGPWRLIDDETNPADQRVTSSDRRHIAKVYSTSADRDEQSAANAWLIVSAPDLRDACKAAGAFTSHVFSCPACLAEWSGGNYFCKDGNTLYETYLRLRDAAIAKARGESP